MRRRKAIAAAAFLLSASVPALSQTWDEVVSDSRYIWAEGSGRSVEQADREALRALGTRIDVAVSSDFLHAEEQLTGTSGSAYASHTSARLSVHSSVRLSNTSMVVLREGRRCRVGRWILRDELEALFADRRQRALEYEALAAEAERGLRIGDALRYHYWAYATLRSLPRPSEVRDADERMPVVTIPGRINDILSGITVTASRQGNSRVLHFRYRGAPVRRLDFSFFDGQAWSQPIAAEDGQAVVTFARGAVGEVIQLRIEYAYEREALLDDDLGAVISTSATVPFRKSRVIFRI